MMKEQAKEMVANYWALERHLEKQKDTEGLDLMIEVIKSSSEFMTSLVEYNKRIAECCKEMMEAVNNGK